MSHRVKKYASKGRTYFYFRPGRLMRGLRPVNLGSDEAEARKQAAEIIRAWRKAEPARRRRREGAYRRRLAHAVADALGGAKRRAAKRKSPFGIDRAYVERLFVEQNARCAITGLQFRLETTAGRRASRESHRPSLDRIDCRLGYVPGNCRLVLIAVNIAMGEWGDEVFYEIAKAAVAHLPKTAVHRKKATLRLIRRVHASKVDSKEKDAA